MDGGLSHFNTTLYGDGPLAIHHLSPNPHRWREREQNQRRHEDYGTARFGLLAVVVHNLRPLRAVPLDRLLRAAVHAASLSKHELLVDLLVGAPVFVIDYHVWVHDNAVFRQVEGMRRWFKGRSG